MALEATWERLGGPDSKAHLRVGGQWESALCGIRRYDGANWQDGRAQDRCSNCVRAAEELLGFARTAPDALITETVVVQVTRSAKSTDTLVNVVARDLAKHKSWQTLVAEAAPDVKVIP